MKLLGLHLATDLVNNQTTLWIRTLGFPAYSLADEHHIVEVLRPNLKCLPDASKNLLLEGICPGTKQVIHMETNYSSDLSSPGWTSCHRICQVLHGLFQGFYLGALGGREILGWCCT